MSSFPKELKYAESHEWIRVEGDDVAVVGITEHAQSQLGELVFVELPDPKTAVHAGDEVCVVESVKAASDVYSPVSGEILETNNDLDDSPSLVNSYPYGDGWLYKIKLQDPEELKDLMDAERYASAIEEVED